jgi:DinB superfamily
MTPTAETYVDFFTMNFKALGALCRDLTEEEARKRPDGRQNPALWMVGHIATYRHEAIVLLGGAPSRGAHLKGLFGRDVRSDASAWPSLEAVLADLAALHAEHVGRIRALGAAAFEPLVTTPAGAEVPAIVFFHFHESYHLGQLGYLRTWLGKTPLVKPRSAAPPA